MAVSIVNIIGVLYTNFKHKIYTCL